jgi:hypothetical protein
MKSKVHGVGLHKGKITPGKITMKMIYGTQLPVERGAP